MLRSFFQMTLGYKRAFFFSLPICELIVSFRVIHKFTFPLASKVQDGTVELALSFIYGVTDY